MDIIIIIPNNKMKICIYLFYNERGDIILNLFRQFQIQIFYSLIILCVQSLSSIFHCGGNQLTLHRPRLALQNDRPDLLEPKQLSVLGLRVHHLQHGRTCPRVGADLRIVVADGTELLLEKRLECGELGDYDSD